MEGIGVELETAGWNGGRQRLGLGRGFKALRPPRRWARVPTGPAGGLLFYEA